MERYGRGHIVDCPPPDRTTGIDRWVIGRRYGEHYDIGEDAWVPRHGMCAVVTGSERFTHPLTHAL